MILFHLDTKGPEIHPPALPGLGMAVCPTEAGQAPGSSIPAGGATLWPLIPGDSAAFTPSRCRLLVAVPVHPDSEPAGGCLWG